MFVDKEYILKSLKLYQAERAPKGWNDAMQRAIEVVEDAPSADRGCVGRWISRDWNETNCKCRTLLYCLPKCSVCGYSADYTNFCPNCGAYMKGDET